MGQHWSTIGPTSPQLKINGVLFYTHQWRLIMAVETAQGGHSLTMAVTGFVLNFTTVILQLELGSTRCNHVQ